MIMVAATVLVALEVKAVVVMVVLVVKAIVVVIVVVAVAPGLCLPAIPDWTNHAGPQRPSGRHGATASAADLARPERSQANTESTCCASTSLHTHQKQRSSRVSEEEQHLRNTSERLRDTCPTAPEQHYYSSETVTDPTLQSQSLEPNRYAETLSRRNLREPESLPKLPRMPTHLREHAGALTRP